MFSIAFVCPGEGGEGDNPGKRPPGQRPPPDRGPPLDRNPSPERDPPGLTSSGGHCSGRYASYWNAFLFYDLSHYVRVVMNCNNMRWSVTLKARSSCRSIVTSVLFSEIKKKHTGWGVLHVLFTDNLLSLFACGWLEYQWRIQDFPQGGAPTPKIAIIFHIFAENCMKMKEFGPPGGGARPWRPPWIRQWILYYMKY